MTDASRTALDTLDWRRRTFELYDNVRAVAEVDDPGAAHAYWVLARNQLLATHPASAILPEERAAFSGVPVSAYDPDWRFEVSIEPAGEPREWNVETGTDGIVPFRLLGKAELPGIGSLDMWKLASYGGGLFVPVKDALAGKPGGTYGGGRYLIDTIKGAWLGEADDTVILDFNFAYNPSCAYDPEWACPLALPSNTLPVEVPVGERMP
ncbi:DUF1684 domain-containing protein [Gryllotalpicola protaetiae]|uniref:DUF1684 domain-containing protein n=1 Tax=Gryllotalpicola protaetiae TaxID=2419771 RepID=A0A387BGI1_9MICO|nr:DUF1684 domain-containing protein [Gryllotalpicola protaetiae]AYG03033.1 DUF1684 domain-containing protein [Gryllotalpicola protaetiae]